MSTQPHTHTHTHPRSNRHRHSAHTCTEHTNGPVDTHTHKTQCTHTCVHRHRQACRHVQTHTQTLRHMDSQQFQEVTAPAQVQTLSWPHSLWASRVEPLLCATPCPACSGISQKWPDLQEPSSSSSGHLPTPSVSAPSLGSALLPLKLIPAPGSPFGVRERRRIGPGCPEPHPR